ncbi:hypothetical protein B9Z48_10205 [Limnohabitans sp. WS1]|nr:hypothetical protein B9Z48_10205 [Limnohabitans sp. WS1]
MLKILEVSTSWGLGGAEQAIEVRARGLHELGFDVIVASVNAKGPRLERLKSAGVRVISITNVESGLLELLNFEKPDVVSYSRSHRLCHYSKNVLEACRRATVPAVVETNIFGRPFGLPSERYPDFIAHVSLTSMLRFVRLSGTTMRAARAAGHAAVSPLMPSILSTQSATTDRQQFRRQLGVSDNEILVCRVGRPDLRKWSELLEAALPHIFARVPNLRFAFLAAPESKIAKLRRSFGLKIITLAPTSDRIYLSDFYAACDFMVHSSAIGESYGLSMAEAMLRGLPVVVDSTPKMDNAQIELVVSDETGFVVQSIDGFVDCVERLARQHDLRTKMSAASRTRAELRYSEPVVLRQWLAAFVEALQRASHPNLPKQLLDILPGMRIPADDEYNDFEATYSNLCKNVHGRPPSLDERALLSFRSGLKNFAYARNVGLSSVASIALSRIRSGRWLHRD